MKPRAAARILALLLFAQYPTIAQARWYDPRTGSWLSNDPVFGHLDDPMSLNPHLYANGNPVRYTDPTGEAVRVTAEEQESLRRFYGADNVTFTSAGILDSTFDVAVTDAGFRHMADYVRQTNGSAQFAERLNRAVIDPFWRYSSLGSVTSGGVPEWIGQQFEGMRVPGTGFRDPMVVSSPESATGLAGLEGFTVPTRPYSHTPQANFDALMEMSLRNLPQLALIGITLATPWPGDEEAAICSAATMRAGAGTTSDVVLAQLAQHERDFAALQLAGEQQGFKISVDLGRSGVPLGLNAPSRPPIFADTNLLIAAAEKGHAAALAEIRAGTTFVTPNQYREFLNVLTPAQASTRRAFLVAEGVEVFGGARAGQVAASPEFQSVFQTVAPIQGRGDAALGAFARGTGFEAVTMEKRIFNFFRYTQTKLGVPIRRVP